jgi:centromere protein C
VNENRPCRRQTIAYQQEEEEMIPQRKVTTPKSTKGKSVSRKSMGKPPKQQQEYQEVEEYERPASPVMSVSGAAVEDYEKEPQNDFGQYEDYPQEDDHAQNEDDQEEHPLDLSEMPTPEKKPAPSKSSKKAKSIKTSKSASEKPKSLTTSKEPRQPKRKTVPAKELAFPELRPMDGDQNDEHGVRKSKRMKIPPLQYWKNEKVIYGRRQSGNSFFKFRVRNLLRAQNRILSCAGD